MCLLATLHSFQQHIQCKMSKRSLNRCECLIHIGGNWSQPQQIGSTQPCNPCTETPLPCWHSSQHCNQYRQLSPDFEKWCLAGTFGSSLVHLGR